MYSYVIHIHKYVFLILPKKGHFVSNQITLSIRYTTHAKEIFNNDKFRLHRCSIQLLII